MNELYEQYIVDVALFENQLIERGLKIFNKDAQGEYISANIKMIKNVGNPKIKNLRTPFIVEDYYLSIDFDPSIHEKCAISIIGTIAPEKETTSKKLILATLPEFPENEKEFYKTIYCEVSLRNKMNMNTDAYINEFSRHGLSISNCIIYSLKNANGHYTDMMLASLGAIKNITAKKDLKSAFIKIKSEQEKEYYTSELKQIIDKEMEQTNY